MGVMARFRVRIIPAMLFGFFGIFLFVIGGIAFLDCLTKAFTASNPLSRTYWAGLVPRFAICAVMGIVCLISAISWWRGRWRWAVLTGALAIATQATAAYFFRIEFPPGGHIGCMRRRHHEPFRTLFPLLGNVAKTF